jgi:hypothetical protein
VAKKEFALQDLFVLYSVAGLAVPAIRDTSAASVSPNRNPNKQLKKINK